MAKNNGLKKQKEVEAELDFSEILDPSYDDELMMGVINGMVEASNDRIRLALELTKLAVEKNTSKDMSEDEIFSIFKKASGVIAESFPLKELWEKFSLN